LRAQLLFAAKLPFQVFMYGKPRRALNLPPGCARGEKVVFA
jgi:hypothetical protein